MTITLTMLLEIAGRVIAASVLGAAIGTERQWRARTAGVRTNALVALGSALFVVLGAAAFPGADPSRVAAQIVSGIGFLGAGVIMKQGGSISGINTAATLWASAAVGALAGSGMVAVAAVGTVAIIGANMVWRPLARGLDRRRARAVPDAVGTRYTFEVRCQRADEVDVRSVVFSAVHRPAFTVRSISAADLPDEVVSITAVVDTGARDDTRLEHAIEAVIKKPEVLGVRWSAEHITEED